MNTEQSSYTEYFRLLADDELLRQLASGRLLDEAQTIGVAEVLSRGLRLPQTVSESPQHEAGAYLGDFVTVARLLEPTEAYLLKAHLESCDIPAVVGDANLSQANQFLAGAIGGARVSVPATYVERASELLNQFKDGKFELDSDAIEGVGIASSEEVVVGQKGKQKLFRVYSHPNKEVTVVVKQGFSWGAFIFGPLWFLVHGMWFYFFMLSALYLGGNLYLRSQAPGSNTDVLILFCGFVVYILAWFFVGKFAHALLATALEESGYKLLATVSARNATYAREAAKNSSL